MDDLLEELGDDVVTMGQGEEQKEQGYLPGYGPVPKSPPPQYDEAVMMKRQQQQQARLPPSQTLPSVPTNRDTLMSMMQAAPEIPFEDEWEDVVIDKPGYGVLVHPIKSSMGMSDVIEISREMETTFKVRFGKPILLRRKEMAYVDCKDAASEQLVVYKRTFNSNVGPMKVMTRREVFGARMAARTPPPPQQPAVVRDATGSGVFVPFGGAPAPKRVRSLSLSSTTTSSSSSTDSRGRKRSRRDKRKLRRKVKKERRRLKETEQHTSNQNPYSNTFDPLAMPYRPPPPDPNTTFLLQPSGGPPECGRCRTTLRRDYPSKCPNCGAPLRKQSDKDKDRDKRRDRDRDRDKRGRHRRSGSFDRDRDRDRDRRDRDRDRDRRDRGRR